MTAPPVYPSKKAPWPWIVAIFAIGLCVLVAVFLALGYLIGKRALLPPKRIGAGKPSIIKTYKDGWKEVALPEIPMRLLLPATPVPEKLPFKSGWYYGVSGWTAYMSHSKMGWERITACWYGQAVRPDLSGLIKSFEKSMASTKTYRNFVGNTRPLAIGSFDGQELDGTYEQEKSRVHTLLFLWQRDDAVYYVSVYRSEGHHQSDLEDLLRIVGSVEYR